MRRESHVRFCEGGGAKLPSATRLVTRNARILDARHEALDSQRIAVADATGLDANAHFLIAGRGNVPLLGYQRSTSLADDHRAHLRHR